MLHFSVYILAFILVVVGLGVHVRYALVLGQIPHVAERLLRLFGLSLLTSIVWIYLSAAVWLLFSGSQYSWISTPWQHFYNYTFGFWVRVYAWMAQPQTSPFYSSNLTPSQGLLLYSIVPAIAVFLASLALLAFVGRQKSRMLQGCVSSPVI